MSFNISMVTTGSYSVEGQKTAPAARAHNTSGVATGNLSGRSVRCSHDSCSKKLGYVEQSIKCICKNSFCAKHRHMESHSCSDLQEYCEKQRAALKESLMGGIVKSKSVSDFSSTPPSDTAF